MGVRLKLTNPHPRKVPAWSGRLWSDLASVNWGGFTVDSSESRAAADGCPEHCLVRGTIDGEIHFELLLPTARGAGL